MAAQIRSVVVIGAGAAGCAAARRLLDAPDVQVTLLESGGRVERDDVRTPYLWPTLMGADFDWKFESVAQSGAADRPFAVPRGRGLGGTTLMNAMIHAHPAAATLRSWGAPLGEADFARVLDRLEDHQPATVGRGSGGAVASRAPRTPNPVLREIVAAGAQAGYAEFADVNLAPDGGIGWFDLSIDDDGHRSDAFSAYLAPVLDDERLDLRTGVSVRRLLLADGAVTGLELVAPDGASEALTGFDEVLLTAGTIESAALLLRSGIGAKAQLDAAGIDVLVDSPRVGAGLRDHPFVPLMWSTDRPTEPPSNQLFEALLYLTSDSAAGRETLSIALGHMPLPLPGLPVPEYGVTALVGLYSPHSVGALTLDPADPFGAPMIDPAYLTDERDVAALVHGIGVARDLLAQPGLDAWNFGEVLPGPEAVGQAPLSGFVRAAAASFMHPVGTCGLGDSPDDVVDRDLRVRGLTNLRIGDASIFPSIPQVAPSFCAQFAGWRAAELLTA